MTISTKKTKIMIFNKSGRMIRLKIRIGELTIESCFQHTYLGTVFTPNNNFKKAQGELYKKACRAFFGYLKEVNIQAGAQISTIRKLSSTLVSPILLYNSEIWGAFLKKKRLKSFESFVDNMFDDSSKHESLQMKMGKIVLGVHKKSPNMAVTVHLLELAGEGNTVIQSGVAECITLVNNNQTCWLTSVLYLLKIIGINLKSETFQLHMLGKNDTITAVKNTLRKRFEDIFFLIRNSSELGLYNCMKENFATERYLSEII